MKTELDAQTCPNKGNHVSADPAYDRIKCPWCNTVYVQKPREKPWIDEGGHYDAEKHAAMTPDPDYHWNYRTGGYVRIP